MSISNEKQKSNADFAAFLKAYYKSGTANPVDSGAFLSTMKALGLAQKANVPLTYSNSTSWFDPVYLGQVLFENLTNGQHKIFSALRKTTFQTLGDSLEKFTSDNLPGMSPILENGQLYVDTGVPDITKEDKLYPVIFKVDWTNTEVAAAMSQIQRSRNTPNLQQIRDFVTNRFFDRVEQILAGVYVDAAAGGSGTTAGYGVDAPATSAGVGLFESIDRLISCAAESGDTDFVSAATDGRIFWNATGTGTARHDRAATVNLAESPVRLPDAADVETGEDYNILDELDSLTAEAAPFVQENNPDYMLLMSPKAYNKIKSEEDGHRIIDTFSEARLAVNGVTSTQGVTGGKTQFSALRIGDITAPIVTSHYLQGTQKSGWLWKNSKHTAGGVGNIYGVNQNAMEFRMLIPPTYRSVQAENALETKHTLYMAGLLIAYNFKSHFALKYIAQ